MRTKPSTLLTKQIQAQPSDVGSLQLLSPEFTSGGLIGRRSHDRRQRLAELTPTDQTNGLLLVEAALRSGDVAVARQASFRLLQPNADPALISIGA